MLHQPEETGWMREAYTDFQQAYLHAKLAQSVDGFAHTGKHTWQVICLGGESGKFTNLQRALATLLAFVFSL